MDVEAMRKKAKLAITPAMLKKSKGVSSSIKLTPWYTRRHMANADKCSCHVVSYSKPRLHPLKKDIIGIKFKVHRKRTRSWWRRGPVVFSFLPETMGKWRKRLDADLMVGRQDVEKEIMDMRDDREGAKAVILNMLSVAGADGTVDDKEEKALRRFADMLGVDIAPYIES